MRISIVVLLLIGTFSVNAQKSDRPARPKLVVGIVVDQMRADYVYRFYDKLGDGGFKRLLKKGFDCRNTNYDYVPTYTGPGHAAIYTGTTPALNGIISNDWYERESRKSVYVAGDDNVESVGTTAASGKMSPHRLLTTTVTDELRLSNNLQSKVIGVCLKDRGCIMPSGHFPNAAYWFDNASGNWITSSYYNKSKELPKWVKDFNDKKLCDGYLAKPWTTLYPIDKYMAGLPNGAPFRHAYKGETANKFPHDLPAIKEKTGYELMRSTPFGDSFTVDFAIETLQNEKMGMGDYTDFLALSFSCTDYVGHQFGINAVETQDTYARLDRDLERLFNYLDKTYGLDNVLVFLTADHGAAQTPDYLVSLGVPAGFISSDNMKTALSKVLDDSFGKGDWIESFSNQQVYFNYKTIADKKLERSVVSAKARQFLKEQAGVQEVWDLSDITAWKGSDAHANRIINGINPMRSGDIAIVLNPAWFDGEYAAHEGTTHGSSYSYDTHVPLYWMGWHIKNGSSAAPVSITDIAPTVSDLLHISFPNGTIGSPITDMIGK